MTDSPSPWPSWSYSMPIKLYQAPWVPRSSASTKVKPMTRTVSCDFRVCCLVVCCYLVFVFVVFGGVVLFLSCLVLSCLACCCVLCLVFSCFVVSSCLVLIVLVWSRLVSSRLVSSRLVFSRVSSRLCVLLSRFGVLLLYCYHPPSPIFPSQLPHVYVPVSPLHFVAGFVFFVSKEDVTPQLLKMKEAIKLLSPESITPWTLTLILFLGKRRQDKTITRQAKTITNYLKTITRLSKDYHKTRQALLPCP